jgi:hypothetical protein
MSKGAHEELIKAPFQTLRGFLLCFANLSSANGADQENKRVMPPFARVTVGE